MKRFCFVLLLGFTLFTFLGCSQTEVFLADLPNGRREVGINLVLDPEKFLDKGYSEQDVVEVKSYVKGVLNAQKSGVQSKVANIKAKHRANINCTPYVNEKKDGTLIILQYKISFINIAAYEKFYSYDALGNKLPDSTEENRSTSTSYKSFLTIKHILKTTTLFSGTGETNNMNTLYDQLRIYLKTNYDQFTEGDMQKVYTRVVTDTKLKSNADLIDKTYGQAIHSWKIEQNDEEKIIEFYKTTANPIGWYTLALSFTALFIAGYYIKVRLKEQNKN